MYGYGLWGLELLWLLHCELCSLRMPVFLGISHHLEIFGVSDGPKPCAMNHRPSSGFRKASSGEWELLQKSCACQVSEHFCMAACFLKRGSYGNSSHFR